MNCVCSANVVFRMNKTQPSAVVQKECCQQRLTTSIPPSGPQSFSLVALTLTELRPDDLPASPQAPGLCF